MAIGLPMAVDANYYSDEDLMTDETIHRAYLGSTTKTSNSIGIQEEAVIWVRCKVKDNTMTEFESFIRTPTYNADNTRVAFRWDQGTPREARWNESTNSQSFFAPKPLPFVIQLYNSDTLVFQWTPYSSGTRAVKFELNEFKKDLNKLIEAGCGDFQ